MSYPDKYRYARDHMTIVVGSWGRGGVGLIPLPGQADNIKDRNGLSLLIDT